MSPAIETRDLRKSFGDNHAVAGIDLTGRFVGPYAFGGTMVKVTVDLDTDQDVDHEAAGTTQVGRE